MIWVGKNLSGKVSVLEKCELCGNPHEKEQINYPCSGSEKKSLHFSNISICPGCGFGFAEPRRSQHELDHFYSSGQYWESGASDPTSLAHQNIQAHVRMKEYCKFLGSEKKVSLLEIGSGHGNLIKLFLTKLSDQIETFYFIEPDEEAASYIFGLVKDDRLRRVNSIHEIDEKLDAVIMNHVLEHVASPVSFLEEVKSAMLKGGFLFIETPRHDFLFKDSVFPHTLFFNQESFKFLAKSLDLQVRSIKEFGSARCIEKNQRHKFKNRLRGKAFQLSVKYAPFVLQKMANNLMFEYGSKSDRIWLAGVFQL
ncbi:MAG: SAM-dependent methyltransferase [Bacteriovoracaceae bacterium]|jgi:SAM-dependent methyltransferase